MERWRKVLRGLVAALVGGGLTYQFVGGVEPIYSQTVSAAAALPVGLSVYAVAGLAMRQIRSSDHSSRVTDVSDWARATFSPMRGAWQWLRVAIALYLGGATYGLTRNALFDRGNVRMLSVTVGFAIAVLTLNEAARSARE